MLKPCNLVWLDQYAHMVPAGLFPLPTKKLMTSITNQILLMSKKQNKKYSSDWSILKNAIVKYTKQNSHAN